VVQLVVLLEAYLGFKAELDCIFIPLVYMLQGFHALLEFREG
jgi:hypothetical protein